MGPNRENVSTKPELIIQVAETDADGPAVAGDWRRLLIAAGPTSSRPLGRRRVLRVHLPGRGQGDLVCGRGAPLRISK